MCISKQYGSKVVEDASETKTQELSTPQVWVGRVKIGKRTPCRIAKRMKFPPRRMGAGADLREEDGEIRLGATGARTWTERIANER